MATDLDEMLAVTEALLRGRELAPLPLARPPAPRRATRVLPAAPTHHRPAERRPPARGAQPLLSLVIVAVLGLPAIAPRVRAEVDGRAVTFYSSAPRVADALRLADRAPIDGALVAAVSRRQLESRRDRAVVRRNGIPVATTARIDSGDRLVVTDGRSAIEGVVSRSVIVPGADRGVIEYGLWHAPRDGFTDQLVGERSGEVVSEQPRVAPVAARPVSEPAVALTFDDGPNPTWTPAVLAVLRAAGVKATFCVVGYAARRYPELVKAIHDEGHVLCNHTMNHVQLLGRKTTDVLETEIAQGGDAIERAAGARPRFFRAPGGTWDSNLIDEVHHQEMRALGWNVDPADFERPGAATITARVMEQLRPGAVVLLHDGGGDRGQTVAQLRALIDRLRAAGYTIRVPE